LEYFLFGLNQFKTEPGGIVLPGPPVSAPHHAAPLPLTPSRTQPLPTGPTSPGPACRPPASLTPRRSPLSRCNGATQAHLPGADAGCPSCPPPHLGPPLSSSFSPPRGAEPRIPYPFPLSPCHLSAIKRCRPPSRFPFPPHSFSPALKHATTSPVHPRIGRWPRTPGPSLPSSISPETPPPSARSVSP
jgi:hypothetical protein